MVDIAGLRDLDKHQLFNAIRGDNPMAYGDIVPVATQANIERTFRKMTEYTPAWNSFVATLLNRIGLTIFNNKKTFQNPLAEFKSDQLGYGSVVQEVQTGLLRAHTYDPNSDGETVFERENLNTKVLYHELNRQDYYKVTTNRHAIAQAFMSESGVIRYIEDQMSALVTSDNLAEYKLMVQLLRMYHESGGYFYQIAGSASILNDADRAKDLLRKIRATAKNMAFPNTRYNAMGMPTWADPSELVIFTTPTQESFIDVDALAGAFNLDRMNVSQRIVTIPDLEWPLPDVNAIITTRDFFKVFDNLLTFEEMHNPQSLLTNHFLHHWQIISCSLFAPAVALTNSLETVTVQSPPVEVTLGTVEAIHIYPRLRDMPLDTATRGEVYPLDVEITVVEDGVMELPVIWEVRGNESSQTDIDKVGTLRVAPGETATSVTVRAYMANDPTVNAELSVTLSGPIEPAWRDGLAGLDEDDEPGEEDETGE